MARMMGATDYRGQTWDSDALTSSQVRAREHRQWRAERDQEAPREWYARHGLLHIFDSEAGP